MGEGSAVFRSYMTASVDNKCSGGLQTMGMLMGQFDVNQMAFMKLNV